LRSRAQISVVGAAVEADRKGGSNKALSLDTQKTEAKKDHEQLH
jgi:hypothetical protein